MSIIWHSLVQRVLGELDEVWQLASDKLTKARFDVFGDVATSTTTGTRPDGNEHHQKYKVACCTTGTQERVDTDTLSRRGACLPSLTLHQSMYVKLRATGNSWLDKMAVNNRNQASTKFQATSALKLNRNAPSSSRSSLMERNFATSFVVSVVLQQAPS